MPDKKRKSEGTSPKTIPKIATPEKKKKQAVNPVIANPPTSVGDALKDSIRSAQKKAAPAPAATAATTTSWETDEAAPFPRGGGSVLTPLEYKEVTMRAKEDALFETRDVDSAPAEAVDPERTAMGAGKELVRAHNLGRRQLVAGVRLLCAVSEVSSDRLLMQLPCRLSGRVERSEVSDELSAALDDGSVQAPPDLRRLFKVGEVLCCAVLTAAGASAANKGQAAPPIELTLRLSVVQTATLAASPRLRPGALVWATLRSSEEYGFVVDTGAPSGGFLKRDSWKAAAEPAKWRPHLCATTTGGVQQARKPLQLAAVGEHGDWATRTLNQETALKFEGLQPGMIVDAKVVGVLGDGVRLVFCGYFEGTASCEDLGVATAAWPKKFVPGATVTARILWVHPATKAIALGLSKHLISCTPYAPQLPLATTLSASYEVVLKGGALVSVAGDADGAPTGQNGNGGRGAPISAWLAKSAVVDLKERQKAEDALKRLKVGGSARGVVVGVRYLEGLLEISTRASALGEEWMTHDDIEVGKVYDGSVAKIDGRGLRVRLARGLYGTVRMEHLSDKQLQRPLDKFKKGMDVRALVIESEPERKKLMLSLKAPLVASSLTRVATFEEAMPGTTTHGVVQRVRPKSILIELLGGVKGIVRGSELKARFGALWDSDPSSCYREGNVVECTVLTCAADEKKLLLTLLSAEEAAAKPAAKLMQKGAAKRKRDGDDDDEAAAAAEPSSKAKAKKLKGAEEATPGTHALATVVALGEHGQLLCRLDKNGSMLGRIHLSELADPGVAAKVYRSLPSEPLHVVVLGVREDGADSHKTKGAKGGVSSLELSARPSERAAGKKATPAARLASDDLRVVRISPTLHATPLRRMPFKTHTPQPALPRPPAPPPAQPTWMRTRPQRPALARTRSGLSMRTLLYATTPDFPVGSKRELFSEIRPRHHSHPRACSCALSAAAVERVCAWERGGSSSHHRRASCVCAVAIRARGTLAGCAT